MPSSPSAQRRDGVGQLDLLARAHHVGVIETGEGADELFLGYDGHLRTLEHDFERIRAGRGWIRYEYGSDFPVART